MINETDDGEDTLLERMLHTLVIASPDTTNFSDGPTPINNSDDKAQEMDLAKILSTSTEKILAKELEDQLPVPTVEQEIPIDVLYQRRSKTPFYFAENRMSASSWESQFKNEMSELLPSTAIEDEYEPKRYTTNMEYRLFMTEVVFIKRTSKEILEALEDTKKILSQNVRIKHDPGFGRINLFQAWVWICKEANMASCSALNDKKERKKLRTFISDKFAKCEKKCRKLRDDMKNLQKCYEKLVREFNIVNEKYQAKFFDNLSGAKDFELEAPGYGFFSHKTESVETIDECETSVDQDKQSTNQNAQGEESSEKSLTVRLGIDGVTVRSSTGNWLKVQSVDKHQDKEILFQIFINAMLEPCNKAKNNSDCIRETLTLSNKDKELHKYPSHTICQSLHKLKMVLDAAPKKSRFLPKEEVCMLYTLKSAKAVFDLITPVCVDVILITERILNMGSTLVSKKSFFKSRKSNHAPLDRLMRIEMEVSNTSIDVTTMLNRYPNIRDARKFRDKLLQPTEGEDETEDQDCKDEDDDLQIERLYACTSEQFSKYSVNPLPESMLIPETQRLTNNLANSTTNSCHMFDDFESEYKKATTKLATTRQIQSHMVTLCSDSIRMFYESVEGMTFWKNSVLENIEYAVENLLYGLPSESTSMPNTFWIQLMCKYIQNWDFHILPKHFKRHFYDLNDYSLKWIHKLEVALGEFTQLVLKYKNDLTDYHGHMELSHGFTTWIRKDFSFNPRQKMIDKWNEEAKNTDSSCIDLSKPASQSSSLLLDFTDLDMKLIEKSADRETLLLTQNQSSSPVQIGLVSLLFSKLDEISRRAIVNINRAVTIYRQHIHLIKLRSTTQSDINSPPHSNFHQLENLVLALTMEMMHKDLRETICYIAFLNETVGQFNNCFQLVQLQLDDREIIVNGTDTLSSKHNSNKVGKHEEAHYKHDTNLNETTQLLRNSISNMPNLYEIKQESTINSFTQWVKIAQRDVKLLEEINSPKASEDEINTYDQFENNSKHNFEIETINPNNVRINGLPIKLEEAMMRAASGKGFFPDPTLFTTDEDCWRNICFDLLALAVNNFGELTSAKIVDVNVLLHFPRVSKENLTPNFESQPIKENESKHSIDNRQQKKSIPFVGYTEGLCVLLWFISRNLSERDRGFVTSDDLKILKNNFSTVTELLSWFVKDMQEAEKFLINNLSLAMASIEYKLVPRYIAICPNEEDFLKSHDLEEVGSRHNKSAAEGQQIQDEINDDIEFRWDSSNRHILLCRYKNDVTWIKLSDIHIQGQLKIIHMLIDQLNKEFTKSRDLVRAAMRDMARAKELLENTWKGIAKEMKRDRIPKSSILVMLKLYRHQIAKAALNTKHVLKTTREVEYLLSQSVEYTRRWASESTKPIEQTNDKNYVMKSENLSLNLTLSASKSPHYWLLKDANKIAKPPTNEPCQITQYKITTEANKNIIDIKYAIQVQSSTSLDIHDKSLKVTHHLQPRPKKATPTPETAWKGKAFDDAQKILKSPLINSFYQNASLIERLLMTGLRKIMIILKLPNCNVSETDGEIIPNITGVFTALVGATMNIRFFKDIVPLQRNDLIKSLQEIEIKAGKLRSFNGAIDFLYAETSKIIKSATTLDASFRDKFCLEDEIPSANEIEFSPAEPIYGIMPMEFVEEIATTIAGRVWTIMSGVPHLGVVIKDNKTLESQVLANIPLASKVEVLHGIINFLNQVFDQTSSYMEVAKKDTKNASTLLKSQSKELTRKLKRIKNIQIMDKCEISEHLQGFARIIQACKEANKLAEQITEMINSTYEILNMVKTYLGLKFQCEPVGGFVTVDNEMLTRARNWQTLENLTGVTNTLPHPILKTIVKRPAQDHVQATYKTALENRMLELEMQFDNLFAKHVAVDIPIKLAPTSGIMRVNEST